LGGSMLIFTFAGFFAIAYSVTVSRKGERRKNHSDNESRYDSDIIAMIGTVFLWVLWPSFNAAFAPDNTQHRVIINTILGLASSVIFAFLFSRAFRGGKFSMHDIQRCTLAGMKVIKKVKLIICLGGIGMGSCTSFLVSPGGALTLGAVAGAASTLCYNHLQVLAYKYLKLDDTFGVLSTYLIPGVIGGLGGVVSTAIAADSSDIFGQPYSTFFSYNGNSQWIRRQWTFLF
jgi:ammonium transporter Rh